MNIIKKVAVAIILFIIVGIFSCKDPVSPIASYTVTITGKIVNKASTALDSVDVVVYNPFTRDTSKSDGTFKITFTSNQSLVTDSIRFTHYKFYPYTLPLHYGTLSKAINFGPIVLSAYNPADDSIGLAVKVRYPTVLKYIQSTYSAISIRGAGGNSSTNLTFQLFDSLGNSIDENGKATVKFELVTKPDAVTELSKSSEISNSTGVVVVKLTAGQTTGIAQIQAIAGVKNAVDTTKIDTIKSQIVSIPIYSGFPDSSHFTLWAEKVNIAGGVTAGISDKISAIISDQFGNPVQSGTVVLFNTTGGIISPASDTTSQTGSVNVNLISGNPVPSNGIATITATVSAVGSGSSSVVGNNNSSVIDEKVIVKSIRNVMKKSTSISSNTISVTGASSNLFSKSINVLFSGAPTIYSADSVFTVPLLGTKSISFKVADKNGNPMSAATTITVTGSGLDTTGIVLSGNVNETLIDTYDKSFTNFSVDVKDKRTTALTQSKSFTLTVEVQGDNGNIKKTFSGMLTAAEPSDSGFAVDSLFAFTGLNANYSIYQSSPISFGIFAGDKKGNPVPLGMNITFSTDAGLISPSALTDASGRATASLQILNDTKLLGIRFITAKAIGANGATVTKTKNILLTGLPKINVTNAPTDTITIADGGFKTVHYTVSDTLGNPISSGHTIAVALSSDNASSAIALTGDISKTMEDLTNSGTSYNILLSDKTAGGGVSGNFKVVITVSGITGTYSKTINAVLLPYIAPPTDTTYIDQQHFTIAAANYNFPGLQKASTPTLTVSVTASDVNGNPVPNTKIFFNSSHGSITKSGTTDNAGSANVLLAPGNPYPNSPDTLPGLAAGYGRVYAQTTGKDSVQIKDSILILWTGSPIITNTGVDTFTVYNGGSRGPFTFKVTDKNGHPLSAGTTISVSSTAGTVTGAISTTLNDTFNTGEGITTFTVYLKDDNPNDTNPPVSGEIIVTVVHPIYGTYKSTIATGTVD